MNAAASSTTMSRGATRTRLVVVTSIALVVALLATGSALVADPNDKLMLRASFSDASPLLEGNDVRLGGVKVGEVATMRTDGEAAEVTIELDGTALPVHTDASLTIRPVSLLGERYVELDRGSPDAPVLDDGAHLGLSRTGSSVDIDEVLNSLDEPTSAALAALVGTLGKGMDGNGDDVRRAVRALAPALGDTQQLTGTLREQNRTLNSLVTSLEKVASGVATDEGRQLDRLVDSTLSVLHRTQVHEKAFRDLMSQLPGTLREARRTLTTLEGTAAATAPTLRALRPTTRDLEEVSSELLAFADAADPALAAANPVLAKAEKLLEKARPVARLLREQSPAVLSDVKSLDPLTRDLTNDITAVMDYVRGWALTTNGRDGLSHYFRAGLILSEYSATGLLPGGDEAGSNQPKKQAAPEEANGGLLGSGGLLGEDGLLGSGGPLGGLLSPKTDRTGGVTGLTPEQESGALSFLLGGS